MFFARGCANFSLLRSLKVGEHIPRLRCVAERGVANGRQVLSIALAYSRPTRCLFSLLYRADAKGASVATTADFSASRSLACELWGGSPLQFFSTLFSNASKRCSNSLISCSIIHIDKSFHKISYHISLSSPVPILAW